MISLCLIVKNEIRFIERCLQPLVGRFAEICVLDHFSEDGTFEYLQTLDCKLKQMEWKDDFSTSRNFCAEMASQEWILFLDADEELLSPSIENLKNQLHNTNYFGFRLPVQNYVHEGYWQPVAEVIEAHPKLEEFPGYVLNYSPRVYRNFKGIKWSGKIHETFLPSMRELSLEYANLENVVIHHFGSERSQSENKEKLMAYIKLLLQKVESDPENKNSWHELGVAFTDSQMFDQAVQAYDRAIRLAPDWVEPKRNLGILLNHHGRGKEAEAIFRSLLSQDPQSFECQIQLAQALLYQRKFEESLKALQDLGGEKNQYAIVHRVAGIACYELGKKDQALSEFRQASQIDPADDFSSKAAAEIVKELSASSQGVES